MDVDDDDECTNAAAAHAAFVMTVSAARMYWLLRYAQHVRDINIHKLHPLPEKNRLGLCQFFLHNGNSRVRYMPISITIFCTVEHSVQRDAYSGLELTGHIMLRPQQPTPLLL